MPEARMITRSIAASVVRRWNRSSLSQAVANHVNSIHAHHTGRRADEVPSSASEGSVCSPSARAATAATKHRSKNSSSHVLVRSPLSKSRIGAGRNHRPVMTASTPGAVGGRCSRVSARSPASRNTVASVPGSPCQCAVTVSRPARFTRWRSTSAVTITSSNGPITGTNSGIRSIGFTR